MSARRPGRHFSWTTADDSLELYLTCESDDETVATAVMEDEHSLKITAVGKGVTTVKASLYDTEGNLHGVWPIEIRVDSPVEPAPISFQYDAYATCPEGGSDSWRWVNLLGDTVNYFDYEFAVSDETVLSPGWCEFWGKSEGVATYTATSKSDPQYSATTTVYVQEWTLKADKTELGLGDTVTLTLENYPTAVPYEWMNWNYDEWMFSEVSRTDHSITLRARCLGTTEINADVYMGERGYWKNETIQFSITGDLEYRMNESDVTMNVGEVFQFHPEYADINWDLLTWSTSDDTVATVDANGNVTAAGLGQCEITCTLTFNNGATADAVCYVSVVEPEWSIVHLDIPDAVYVGDTFEIWTSFETNGLWIPDFTASIDNEAIAAFEAASEANGWSNIVTAKGTGVLNVTVTASDDTKTETYTQSVRIIDTDLRFSQNGYDLYTESSRSFELIAGNGKEIASVVWTSHDTTSLTFDENGTATTYTETGRVLISATATFTDGTTGYATAEVYINELGEIYANSHIENYESHLFTVEGYGPSTSENIYLYLDTNAPDELIFIEWWTDNVNVATIESNYDEDPVGRVAKLTAVGAGATTYRVSVKIGEEGQYYSDEFPGIVSVEEPFVSVNINQEEITLALTDHTWLDISADANISAGLTYSSSDESVVLVSANGRVTPIAPGTAVITVTNSCGALVATDSVPVTVTGIEAYMAPESAYIEVGSIVTVMPEYMSDLPEGTTVYTSSFSSSNEAIATVDGLGNVYAKAPGTAVITYRSETSNGVITCKSYIWVEDPAAEVTLNETYLLLSPGEQFQLEPVFSGAEPDSFSWSSSDENTFSVDENGLVTASSNNDNDSSAYITYTAVYGDTEYVARSLLLSADCVAQLHWLNDERGLKIGDERDQYISWNTTAGYETLDWDYEIIGDTGVITAERTDDHNLHIKAVGNGQVTLVVRLYDASEGSDNWTYHTRYASYWVGSSVEPTEISYEYETYAVRTEASGEWNRLNLSLLPSEMPENFPITAVSSDESIFAADGYYAGYGKNEGVVTYTATVQEYPQYTATTTIYVQDWYLKADKTELNIGDTVTLTVENYPTAVPYEWINWEYDSRMYEEVARDDYSITLRAKTGGNSDVRVYISMGSRGYSGEESVSLTTASENYIYIDTFNYELVPDEAVHVQIDGSIASVALTSSDETIVTVNDRKIIASAKGECDVTATVTFEDSTTAEYTLHVTVVEPSLNVTKISYDDVAVGAAVGPQVDWEFAGYHEPEITVKSSDETIAKTEGRDVIGVSAGTATLTITVTKGDLSQTFEQEITVLDRAAYFASTDYTVYEGCTLQLEPVLDEGRVISQINWVSLDPSVATVDENGVVTGVSAGSRCIVYANVRFEDGESTNATCWVHVESITNLGLSYDLENDHHELSTAWYGNNPQSNFSYIHFHNEIPENLLSIEWTVDDPTIASIETNAEDPRAVTVIAESEGETTVRAKVELINGENVFNETMIEIPVYVYSASYTLAPPSSTAYLSMDETHHLDWGETRSNVYWPIEYQYISSDESVVLPTVHEHVETVNPGTATVTRIVTVKGQELARASIEVTVWGPVIKNTQSVTLDVNETTVLTGEAAGVNDGTHDIVIYSQAWYSSDENVAVVSPDGIAAGVHPGKATLIYLVDTNYGSFSGYCDVTVNGTADVTLNETHLELTSFDTFQLELSSAIGTPESVTWSVEGATDSVSVDQTGLVSIGDCDRIKTAVVTATAIIGGKEYFASCEVDVLIQTVYGTNLHFNTAGWANLEIGESRDVTEGLWLAGDDAMTIEYVSDDPSVAYVDEGGVLHGIAKGTTYVYLIVTRDNGEVFKRNMYITVGMGEPSLENFIPEYDSYVVGAEGFHDYHEVWIEYETVPFNMYGDAVFTSSNDSVAMADGNCIHGLNPGTATITITSPKNTGINISVDIAVFGELEIMPQMSGTLTTGTTMPLHIEGQTWKDSDVSGINWSLMNMDSNSGVESWVDEDMNLHVGNDAGNLRLHAHITFRNGHIIDVYGLIPVDNTNTAQYAPYYCDRATNRLIANVGDQITTWVHTFDNVDVASVTYESDDPAIASVSSITDSVDSVISCNALGSTNVTATITRTDGVVVKAAMAVQIVEPEQPVFEAVIDSRVIKVGESVNMHLRQENSNSRRPTSNVTFSDETIAKATYDVGTDTWNIEGLKAGMVEMTVTGTYGGLTTTHTYPIYIVED